MQPHTSQSGEPPFSDEQLVAFVLAETDAATTSAVASAVQADKRVAERVSQLRTMHERLGRLKVVDASFAVSPQQRAMLAAIMPARQADWFTKLADRAGEVALLVLDSLRRPAVAGYRSIETGGARLLRYECMEGTLDLRVEFDIVSGQIAITGQFVGSRKLSQVRLLQHGNGTEVSSVTVAADGYFESTAPAGMYVFELIATDGTSAVIPRIELGDRDTSNP